MAQPRLLDQVRSTVRAKHYSPKTEEAYVSWTCRFVRFHRLRHPREMGAAEIDEFLTFLAVERGVSASTQNQAASALVFLYRRVLGIDIQLTGEVVRARQPTTMPVVLTRHEVGGVLDGLTGDAWLVAVLLYGSGLRLSEALQLRIKDLDFQRREILVRRPKTRRDRVTVLPGLGHEPLLDKISRNRATWNADRERGGGWVPLPDAFANKSPEAGRDWAWQWVFPASTLIRDPSTSRLGRQHLHPSAIQELLGHRSLKTTMRYTHVLNRGGLGVRSPADTAAPITPRDPKTR